MEKIPDGIAGFSIQAKASMSDRVCLRIEMQDSTGKFYEAMVTINASEFTEAPPKQLDIVWNAKGAPR